MPPYRYQATEHFRKKLLKIRSQDPEGHRHIMKVVDRLLESPSGADGKMHGSHRGKFKKYVGRDDYRLIYYYCELCRKASRRLPDICSSCESIPDNSVIFFDVLHKNEKDRLHY
jgi:mRNA-degrading endonuclease RelE of RelBE toxin-antitoxin system